MASVLIIDAEEDFAQQLSEALRHAGVEAAVTGDGKVGLDMARINLPDAIVLCVELPRMSGYSICAKLKKDDALKSVPVIITSSEATPETFEQHRKLKSRAEEYLKKPFPAAQLLDVLRPYLAVSAAGVDTGVGGAIDMESLAAEGIVPATLPDSDAFSEEEARSMRTDGGGRTAILQAPELEDDVPSADAEVVAEAPSLSQEISLGVAGAMDVGDDDYNEETEALTTVGRLEPPPRPQRAPGTDTKLLERELEILKAQLEESREQQAEAERQRDEAQANERAARAEAEAAVSRRPAVSSRPGEAGGRDLLEVKRALTAKEREILQLKESHAKELTGLREQVNEKEKEVLGWREREAELEDRIVQLEESLESSEAGRGQLETRVAGLESKLAEIQRVSSGAIADLKRRLAEAQAKHAEEEATIGSLGAEIDSLNARLLEKEEAVAAAGIERDSYAQQVEAHQNEIRSLSNELAAAGAEAQSLRQKLKTRDEEATALNGRIGGLNEDIAAAQRDAQGLRQNIAELETQRSAVEHELVEARSESDGLRGVLRELEVERERIEGDLARALERIQSDETIRAKALKAMEIALALLQEAGYEGLPAEESTPVSSSDGTSAMS